MPDSKLNQQRSDLEQRWQELHTLINGLKTDHGRETRSEERHRIQGLIDKHTADQDEIEEQLTALNNQQKIADLREKLSREERNGSYLQAIETAEQILAINSDDERIQQKISKLKEQQAFYHPSLEALGQLGGHIASLGMPLYEKLAHALHPKNKRADLITLLLASTQQFLRGDMDTESFKQLCEYHLSQTDQQTTPSTELDYHELSDRILNGHTVLFFGTDMAGLYDDDSIDEQTLAEQLATAIEYDDFQGNLSTIAELYQLRPGGKKALLDGLQDALPSDAQRFMLYQSLARTSQHLILVTSAYDCLLEDVFRESGKPFVELSSIINRTRDYDIGHVVLNYSDDDKDEIVYPQEKLSTLNLLDTHTIIYKIRGSSMTTQGQSLSARKDALTLSESNYLIFAENSREIIPSFLAEHLREREILFAGFTPRSWEDRLLVRILLSGRYKEDHLCSHMSESVDPLETAFWKKQNVEASGIDFNLLDEHLQEAVS